MQAAPSPSVSSAAVRWIPAFGWLRSYNANWLRGDIDSSITLAAYLLPTALAAGTAMLVAFVAFLAWLTRAGAILNFISESVRTGFKCGVALFLASTQLPKLCGFNGAHGSFWENSGYFLQRLNETNPAALTIGGAALAVLILGKVFLKNKPVALFVVIGGIVAASALSLDARGVKLLGEVPHGLPQLGLPRGI